MGKATCSKIEEIKADDFARAGYDRASSIKTTNNLPQGLSNHREPFPFFELSREVMLILELNLVVRANGAFLKTLGYAAEEVMARPFTDFVHPEDRARTETAFRRLDSNEIISGFENRLLTARGETVHLSWSVKSDAESPRLFACAQDVTILRDKEIEVETRRRALVESSKIASLGKMAGGVAHEINNPLSVIYGRAQLMLDALDAGPPNITRIRENFAKISEVSARVLTIVEGLLNIARDSSADDFAPVSLGDVVQSTLAICNSRLSAHAVEVQVGAFPRAPVCVGREVQISQVLINLIDNACDAVAGVKPARIELDFIESNSQVGFAVVDNGPGLNAHAKEHLFEPFFTSKPLGEGTGLGLNIAKAIVDQHHGEIYLDHESSATRFVVLLPKA